MKKFLTIMTCALLISPAISYAQAPFLSQVDNVGEEVYGTAEGGDLLNTLGVVIIGLMSALGIVFLILIIYAGFLWMTAGGNKDQLKKAQQLLLNAAIGLIILVSSYAIASYVIDLIQG